MEDLGPRILSAAALIPAAIGAALSGGPWLAGAAGAAVVAMSYEYARMSEPKSLMPAFLLCLIAAIGAIMAQSWGQTTLALGWLLAFGVISALRRRDRAGILETAGGVIYVGAPCVLFLALRAQNPGGLEAVLGLFVVIWSADVAAYFAGRLLGGPKLWTSVSPGKTWAGTLAGVIAGVGAGAACGFWFEGPMVGWLIVGGVLSIVGLAGDLFESYLKRRFGVKDSSRLIPGHGGVLDRLDGLMAASTIAAIAVWSAPDLLPLLAGEQR
jgi:phosphatidate cytidylyltransferase